MSEAGTFWGGLTRTTWFYFARGREWPPPAAKKKSPAEAGQVSNQRLSCVRHPESAPPYPGATLRASRMQAGLLADIPRIVAFIAVSLILPIGLEVGVGLVLAVAPG